MLDSLQVPAWIAAVLGDLQDTSAAELATLVVTRPASTAGTHPEYPRPNPLRIAEFYRYLDYRVFQPSSDALSVVDLHARTSCEILEVTPVDRDRRFALTDDDARRLRQQRLDVLLVFASGVPAASVARSARHGVWYFLDHERLFDRRPPMGFWEVLDRQAMTQCLLVQQASTSEPVVIHEYHGPTNLRSIRLSRNDLLWKSVPFVSRSLANLQRHGAVHRIPGVRARPQELLGPPVRNIGVVAPILRHVGRFLQNRHYERHHIEQWAILAKFSAAPDAIEHRFQEYRLLEPAQDRFWADPFPVHEAGRYFLFFEEFLYAENKGHLSVAEIGPQGLLEPPRVLLRRAAHLSYPFVFRWQDRWYLIPESQEENRIDLYQFDQFPYTVRYHSTLMSGLKAADATLFEHQGRWWMMVAVATPGTMNFDELCLFLADSPLGPWTEHPGNPIKSDVRGARPAGRVFVRNGRLFRPSQDSSRRYGYAMRLQEIKVLTEDAYVEEEVDAILPDWSPEVIATHTFNFAGQLTVIDAQRRRRRIASVRQQVLP